MDGFSGPWSCIGTSTASARTGWTSCLEVTRIHNSQRHSTTGLVPEKHFATHNTASRERTPLLRGASCVLTVSQAEQMEKLRWVTPCRVAPSVNVGGSAISDVQPIISTAATSDVVSVDGSDSTVTVAAVLSATAQPPVPVTISATSVMITTTSSRSNPPPTSSQSPTDGVGAPMDIGSTPSRIGAIIPAAIRILLPGERCGFDDPEAWQAQLHRAVKEMLSVEGTLAQGDCGPASGSRLVTGRVATEAAAAQCRCEVTAYGRSAAGVAYYKHCQSQTSEQVPASLEQVLADTSKPRADVHHEWFTLFGGLHGLNVFVFTKLINLMARDGDQTTYGIQLVTNGGTLVKEEHENTVAVYYQGRIDCDSVVGVHGHYEAVVANDEEGSYVWRYDHPVVKDCLLPALQSVELRHTRAKAIAKQLRASSARIDAHNDVISDGDCVWLTVPQKVVDSVRTSRRLHDEQRHCVPKMLCKVARVKRVEATTAVGAQVTFILLSPNGVLKGWYPIDEVARCSPPPDDEPVTAMAVPKALPTKGTKFGRVKLATAYRKYVQWLTVRSAARTLQSRLLGPPTSAALARTPSEAPSVGPSTSSVQSIDNSAYHADLPCQLCRRTRAFEERSSCAYSACRAPLCKQATGCTGSAVAVELLLYCSTRCASSDHPGVSQTGRSEVPLPRPNVRLLGPNPTATSAAMSDESELPSQPAARPTTAIEVITCKTCSALLPSTAKRGVCDRCHAYICKVPRGSRAEGCNRAGWSGAGSGRVAGILQCVECRCSNDPSWSSFIRLQTEKGAVPSPSTPAMVITIDPDDTHPA
jgi:hypothetical protein